MIKETLIGTPALVFRFEDLPLDLFFSDAIGWRYLPLSAHFLYIGPCAGLAEIGA